MLSGAYQEIYKTVCFIAQLPYTESTREGSRMEENTACSGKVHNIFVTVMVFTVKLILYEIMYFIRNHNTLTDYIAGVDILYGKYCIDKYTTVS